MEVAIRMIYRHLIQAEQETKSLILFLVKVNTYIIIILITILYHTRAKFHRLNIFLMARSFVLRQNVTGFNFINPTSYLLRNT